MALMIFKYTHLPKAHTDIVISVESEGVEWGMRESMASLAGFEPATRCLEGSRSIQLSYRDASGSA